MKLLSRTQQDIPPSNQGLNSSHGSPLILWDILVLFNFAKSFIHDHSVLLTREQNSATYAQEFVKNL